MDLKKLYSALYKFILLDDRYPGCTGILHRDGYMTASSAFTLAHVHCEEYDFDFEDLTIDENGNEVKAKYPNFKHLLDLVYTSSKAKDILKACQNVPKGTKKSGEGVILEVDGLKFHTFQLALLFEVFEILEETPSIYLHHNAGLSKMIMKSANCTTLVMCEKGPFVAKDLIFTVEEALEFNNLKK